MEVLGRIFETGEITFLLFFDCYVPLYAWGYIRNNLFQIPRFKHFIYQEEVIRVYREKILLNTPKNVKFGVFSNRKFVANDKSKKSVKDDHFQEIQGYCCEKCYKIIAIASIAQKCF